MNPPTALANSGDCIGPQLGYTIEPAILALAGGKDTITVVLKAVTILLVFHPFAAGFSLLALLPIIISCCVYHNAPWVISLVSTIAAALVSSVVLAADLALVIVARNRLKKTSIGNFDVGFGNGVWMILAAVTVSWLCVVILSVKVCRCGERR